MPRTRLGVLLLCRLRCRPSRRQDLKRGTSIKVLWVVGGVGEEEYVLLSLLAVVRLRLERLASSSVVAMTVSVRRLN